MRTRRGALLLGSTLALLAGAFGSELLAPDAAARPLKPGEQAKVEKAFRAALREPDDKKRARVLKGVRGAMGRMTVAEIEEVVRDAFPGDEWKRGFTDEIEYESHGETWTYSALLPKKRPKGLVPLVLDVGHASWKDNDAKGRESGMQTWLDTAGCAKEVVYVRTRVLDRLSIEKRYDDYVVPPWRALSGKSDRSMDTVAVILLDAVRDAAMRFPIDPDRVYVQGISQTGYWTWWLGQTAPERWAAIAPVGAVTWHVRRLAPNLRLVPTYVLHGTADPTCPFVQAKQMCADLEALGAPVDFRPTEGGGHMNGVFSRFGEIWPEVMKRTRDPYPAKFARTVMSNERGDAYWLRAIDVTGRDFNPFKAKCRIAGEIDGNTLRVEATGCEQVEVLISSEMVDVTKTVTIELNGKKAWKGKPKPDPEAALETARRRGDGRTFGASVVLKVK